MFASHRRGSLLDSPEFCYHFGTAWPTLVGTTNQSGCLSLEEYCPPFNDRQLASPLGLDGSAWEWFRAVVLFRQQRRQVHRTGHHSAGDLQNMQQAGAGSQNRRFLTPRFPADFCGRFIGCRGGYCNGQRFGVPCLDQTRTRYDRRGQKRLHSAMELVNTPY